MSLPNALLRCIGIASILLAAFGLLYNAMFILPEFFLGFEKQANPYFYPAFYTMSAICVACYVLLLTLGIQFVRLNVSNLGLFVFLFLFEIIYIKVVFILWSQPTIGMSVAEATGVANGGLVPQGWTLFPIWAVPTLLWARHKLTT
jgi:hypothetical protein